MQVKARVFTYQYLTNYGKKRYALHTLYISHFQISHKRTKITIAVSESANEISKVSVASAWNIILWRATGIFRKNFKADFVAGSGSQSEL